MKEERLEILKMLQEGVISADEAEKLLSALDDGKKEEHQHRHRHGHGHGAGGKQWRGFDENIFCGSFFTDFDKGFANFGKAMGDLFGGVSDKGRFKDFDFVSHMGNNIIPEKGDRLEISQQAKGLFKGGCEISLIPSKDEALYIDSQSENSYEILRKGNVIAILCSGDCEISLPQSLEKVSVQLFNGSMEAIDIKTPLKLETFNGDIAVSNCLRPGMLKTLSGDIDARISSEFDGQIEINAVSGDIGVLLPRSFSGQIEAKTISGELECLIEENVTTHRDSGDFKSAVIYKIGDGEGSNRILCGTVSGNVEIDSDEHTD